jgi:hypothetical protein
LAREGHIVLVLAFRSQKNRLAVFESQFNADGFVNTIGLVVMSL